MTWQSEREEWNREGKCARQDCKTEFGRRRFKHSETNLRYCGRCRSLICAWADIDMIKEVLTDGVWTVAQEKSSVSP